MSAHGRRCEARSPRRAVREASPVCARDRWPARAAVLALGLCLLAPLTHAQDRVYRCGAEGRSYSDEPCPGGRTVVVDDARSAEQVAQARAAAQRDARLADAMARERQRSEREAARRLAAGIGKPAAPAEACPGGARCSVRAGHGARQDRLRKVTLYRAPEPR